ncbi:MAG TPA: hypothetical protein VI670_07215 [Thermoanaerobaculia bacterium]|jgi:predicted metalloprotease with PDZ domain
MRKVILLLLVAAPLFGQTAAYRVRFERPYTLHVTATLPIDGDTLEMTATRPGDVAEVDARGWPALVRNLRVAPPSRRPAARRLASPTVHGWRLAHPMHGRIAIRYDVDYAPLAAAGWPAPRETAFADARNFVVIGRSLFITTPAMRGARVAFDLPRGWHAVMPSTDEIVDNLVVFTRAAPDVVTAGRFRLTVCAMGHWRAQRAEVRRRLAPAVARFVRMFGFRERANYLVVLLPQREHGGESFHDSFALTVDDPADAPAWANLIAHEVFHFWNGWRLRGADYASSQWFQEGFTEYEANRATGLDKLAKHVENYRRLAQSLEDGTRKGPPLYSAGALVAFAWDVMIRDATGGKRTLDDFWRALWLRTDGGRRPWTWPDLRAALDRTAPRDWEAFYRAHIHGREPLPLGEIFAVSSRQSWGAPTSPAGN